MRFYQSSTRDRVLLIGALVAGLALRLHRLGAESLWYDEAVSVHLARKSLLGLIAATAGDIHPPGYYLLLHAWGLLARPSLAHGLEFLFAWPSLISGMLLIALLYPVGRRLVGSPAAVAGVWIAAIHPFHIWYAQEVRMYTLAAFLGLLCLYATLRWMEHGRLAWLILYAGSAAAGLYTLYYFVFILAGIGMAALVLSPTVRRFGVWLLSHSLMLLLYGPWIGVFWRQANDPPVPPWRTAWESAAAALAALQEALGAYLVGQTPLGPLWCWALLVVVLSALALLPARSRRTMAALLLYTLGPLLLLFVLSLAVVPLYHVRYLFPFAAVFPLVAGSVLMQVWRRSSWGGALLCVGVAALSLLSLRSFWGDPAYRADNHRSAVAALASAWRPGDVILVNAGWVYPLLEIYWPGQPGAGGAPAPSPLAAPVRLLDVATGGASLPGAGSAPLVRSGSVEGDPSLGWGAPESDFFAISREQSLHALEKLAEHYARLWHYRLYDTVSDPQGDLRAWLDSRTTLLKEETIPGRDYGRVELRDLGHAAAPDPQFAPVRFGDALRLVGVQMPAQLRPGSMLYATLTWEALPGLAELPVGLSSSLRLYDGGGRMLAQADSAPALPTPTWAAGQRVRDPLAVGVPFAAAPGDYTLEVVVYRQDDASPLAVDDSRTVDGQRLILGTIAIAP